MTREMLQTGSRGMSPSEAPRARALRAILFYAAVIMAAARRQAQALNSEIRQVTPGESKHATPLTRVYGFTPYTRVLKYTLGLPSTASQMTNESSRTLYDVCMCLRLRAFEGVCVFVR